MIFLKQRPTGIIGQLNPSGNAIRAWKCTKIVIKRMVFLNDENEVLDRDVGLSASARSHCQKSEQDQY